MIVRIAEVLLSLQILLADCNSNVGTREKVWNSYAWTGWWGRHFLLRWIILQQERTFTE